jgi:hypothetical protein
MAQLVAGLAHIPLLDALRIMYPLYKYYIDLAVLIMKINPGSVVAIRLNERIFEEGIL